MLLAKASGDMTAMQALAEAASKQADSASLHMLVAHPPNGSATTFSGGQTMLHVVIQAANKHLEVRCSHRQLCIISTFSSTTAMPNCRVQ